MSQKKYDELIGKHMKCVEVFISERLTTHHTGFHGSIDYSLPLSNDNAEHINSIKEEIKRIKIVLINKDIDYLHHETIRLIRSISLIYAKLENIKDKIQLKNVDDNRRKELIKRFEEKIRLDLDLLEAERECISLLIEWIRTDIEELEFLLMNRDRNSISDASDKCIQMAAYIFIILAKVEEIDDE